MCSAWHRVSFVGRWTNMTPTFGDGLLLQLSRDASKELRKPDVGYDRVGRRIAERRLQTFLRNTKSKWIEVRYNDGKPYQIFGDFHEWRKQRHL